MKRLGLVSLVGAGPGDPGLLTLKAARVLAACDVLVYDYLASEPIVALASPRCEKIYVGKKAGAHTLTQDEITALIVRLGLEGKRVVRLKGGDVFVFARGGEEAQALHAAGVPFEIIPGITSAIAAPAYAGIPITHRDHNTSFTIATGHEDPTKGYTSLDFAKLANPSQTLVFLMAMGNLRGIVEKLLENGMPADMPTAIVREGTRPQQETLVGTLSTIVAEVERTRFAAPAIVVIGNVVRERESIRWFDRHPLFGKRVLITRPADQAAEFAAKLWELGAEPVIAPTIAIGPPDDRDAARDAVRRVREYRWVVFTSANGVRAFFDQLAADGRDARALGDTHVAAIGPKTSEALTAQGVRTDFIPARYVSEEIAEGFIEKSDKGDRILLYRAQEARDVLPDSLRSAGREVHVIAAYKTTLVEDADIAQRAAECDIWTFASASAVHGFVRNVSDAAEHVKHIACIGPITAQAVCDAGLRANIVAEEYTVDGLIKALRESPPET
jgi:uroporphyrinogen III methyltransferase/synthase